jgi:DNA-binding MarR family transcriptional regulator
VELVNRLEHTGAVARKPGEEDRREVLIELTAAGRSALRKLAEAHREELGRSGPQLAQALQSVLRHSRKAAAHE